jgi:hypothetical protein
VIYFRKGRGGVEYVDSVRDESLLTPRTFPPVAITDDIGKPLKILRRSIGCQDLRDFCARVSAWSLSSSSDSVSCEGNTRDTCVDFRPLEISSDISSEPEI